MAIFRLNKQKVTCCCPPRNETTGYERDCEREELASERSSRGGGNRPGPKWLSRLRSAQDVKNSKGHAKVYIFKTVFGHCETSSDRC